MQLGEQRGHVQNRVLVVLVRALLQPVLPEEIEQARVHRVRLAEEKHVVQHGRQHVHDRLEILSILIAKIDGRSHVMNGKKRHFAADLRSIELFQGDLLAERRLGDDFEGREEIADEFRQHGDFAKQHFQRGAMIEHDLAVLLRDVDPRFDPRLLVLFAVLLDRVFAGLDRAVLLVDSRVQNRVLHDDEAKQHEQAGKEIATLFGGHVDDLLAAQLA